MLFLPQPRPNAGKQFIAHQASRIAFDLGGKLRSDTLFTMRPPGCLMLALIAATNVWAAFDRPSENERMRALGNLFEEPDTLRYLLTPNSDFPPIKLPGKRDWLTLYTEAGQSFEQYCNSGANRPDPKHRTIYLLPIGEFDEESSPPLEEIRAYAAAFFQMEVKLLPTYRANELEFEPRENPRSGQRQLLTKSVMTFLKTRLPSDAYCLLGMTMTDLYPDHSWNYVFGEASLDERVGIYSFARYDPLFWDDSRGNDYRSVILQRSCKVLAHETAHMFGLQHCIYYDCVLNGANHMNETDAQPQQLCPICLRKLQHAIGFDAIKRYQDLAYFYRRQKWIEEHDWVARQLEKVPKEKSSAPGKNK